MQKEVLLLPGPTPVPDVVARAQLHAMGDHRGAEFETVYGSVCEQIRSMLRTKGAVMVLPSSGTGGLEATVQNLFSPGDAVLSVVAGSFGDRFCQIAKVHGLEVTRLDVPWGEAPQVDAIEQALAQKPYRGLLLTHNETSTGVLAPVREIAERVHRQGLLIAVDSISGFPSIPAQLETWHIDAVVACSQKGFMTPPGLSVLGLSPQAAEACSEGERPRFYFDLRPYLKGHLPYTPPLSLIYALEASLKLLSSETAGAREGRHRLMAEMARAGGRTMGLEPLAPEGAASPTVTALRLPEGLVPKPLRDACRRFGVTIAGGQGILKDKVVRIGHMGYTMPGDLLAGLCGIQFGLEAALGKRVADGPAAAWAVWQEAVRQEKEGA